MKGMIYKEITLSKKQALLTGSMFAMFAVLCILVRLSMECGNIADDAEMRGHLIDNIWILRYLPLVVLASSYNPSGTLYDDIESGFFKFCRTTSLKTERLIVTKMITLLTFEAGVYVVNTLYLALLGAVGGDGIQFSSLIILLKMTLFFCIIHLIMLLFSMIAKNKKTFEAIVVTAFTLVAIAFTPFLMNQMEKYSGQENIDVLDIMRLEFAPFEKNLLPICAVLLVLCFFLNLFVGSRLLERRAR